jgi:mono/diheme cytochrome c family protein
LTILGDCAACHTAPGGRDFAGGRPIDTPFGAIETPNITPDRDTGIGTWTDDQFVSALTKGIDDTGAHIYPAMPYTYYTKVSIDDILAIRAYLATVPPVHTGPRSIHLSFPLNKRVLLIGWNVLFFTPGPFVPEPNKSAEWNRGAYLVEGLMHCGMCHTPKNSLGGDKTSQRLRGYALQGWFAPDLTTDTRRGIGGWSNDDIAAYLKTGHNRFAAASGPMAEEVTQSSARMTDADLRAVAVYLKDRPAPEAPAATPLPQDDPSMRLGAAIYRDECSACHTPKGSGVEGIFPTLANSPAVQSDDPTSVVHVILRGARSAGTEGAPTAAAMPPLGWLLNDDQAASVATYVRNSWGNAAPAVKAETVARERRALSESGG